MDRPKASPAREVVVVEHVDRTGLDHLRDVGARRKGPVVAGQDHAADRIVAIEGLQRVDELRDRLRVEGIADLRPVDPDDPDRPVGLGEYELVGHCSLLRAQSSPGAAEDRCQPSAESAL